MDKPITVTELDQLMERIGKKKDEIKLQEDVLKGLNKELSAMLSRAALFLNDLNREDYISPFGKVAKVRKWNVALPQNDIDKQAFLDHLKERGLYQKYVSVHARSLQSLYMADWAEAKSKGEGMTFSMPGIQPPTLFETVEYKPGKKK